MDETLQQMHDRYLAGTASDADMKALRSWLAGQSYQGGGPNPTLNAYSPGLSSAVSAQTAGEAALASQGLANPAGSSMAQWAAHSNVSGLSPAELAQKYVGAVETQNAFGPATDLSTAISNYMDAVRAGDRAAATVYQTQALKQIPASEFRAVIEAADPDFEAFRYNTYYDPNNRKDAYGDSIDLNRWFSSGGSSGWAGVIQDVQKYGMTPEQVAAALGISVNEARIGLGVGAANAAAGTTSVDRHAVTGGGGVGDGGGGVDWTQSGQKPPGTTGGDLGDGRFIVRQDPGGGPPGGGSTVVSNPGGQGGIGTVDPGTVNPGGQGGVGTVSKEEMNPGGVGGVGTVVNTNPGGVGGVGTVSREEMNPGGVGGVGTTQWTNPGGVGGIGTVAPVNLGYNPTAGTVAMPGLYGAFNPAALPGLSSAWTAAPGSMPTLQPMFGASAYNKLAGGDASPASQNASFQELMRRYAVGG